jgi:hypothetical protein
MAAEQELLCQAAAGAGKPPHHISEDLKNLLQQLLCKQLRVCSSRHICSSAWCIRCALANHRAAAAVYTKHTLSLDLPAANIAAVTSWC